MQEHAAISSLGAYGGACSVGTTSRLRHEALVVHGSKRNDAGSLIPVVERAETEQFYPTCRTQINPVWPVNKGPCWPGLRSSVCVLVVFATCRDGDTRSLKSTFSETLQGNICAQTACRTTLLGLSNTYRRGDTLRGSKTKPYTFRTKKDVFLSCFVLSP